MGICADRDAAWRSREGPLLWPRWSRRRERGVAMGFRCVSPIGLAGVGREKKEDVFDG
jgi:hypothetical protein